MVLVWVERIFLFTVDMVWKLLICFLAFVVLCIATLFISAYYAEEDFRKLNVQYTDAMVPWMKDRIDHYMLMVFPCVLVVFLIFCILYKRYFE
jgi:hypothetical protein